MVITSIRPAYRRLFEPRSQDIAYRHHEFMTNILLFGLVLVAILRLLSAVIHQQPLGFDQQEHELSTSSVFLLIILCLWNIARKGQQVIAAFGILGLLSCAAIQLTLTSSFELPIAQLVYALVIVIAGILLPPRKALAVTVSVSMILLVISYAQISNYLHPNIDWVKQDFQMEDVFGYVAILCLIALVSWLANREISRSLKQALATKLELAKERDNLEIKVAERTRELEQAQRSRTLELKKFAELGRVSATLIHEIANPLTAASLHLELFDGQKSAFIDHARNSLNQLERYLQAARLQLKTEGNLEVFSIRRELQQVSRIMKPLANRASVKLIFEQKDSYKLYGDPVKFNQLVANLIANSLEAYENEHRAQTKRIKITVETSSQWLEIIVTDWGSGIKSGQLGQLFDAFYTTKTGSDRGTGIGLTMVKEIVERDFAGNIDVTSSPDHGTTFTVRLKNRQTIER